MYAHLMWWLGMVVEATLLVRGGREKLVSRFPLFYSYLAAVLIEDILRYVAFYWYPPAIYANIYWSTQFVSLVMGSIVLFEIYLAALREHPGTARMARNILGIAFAGILFRAGLAFQIGSAELINVSFVKLERDLRAVQSIAIVILIVLFLWYAIPLARNLGGILLGYSLFVALSVLQLTVIHHFGARAQSFWNHVQPMSYTVVLAIWTRQLWSSDGATQKRLLPSSDQDYEKLAAATSRSLEQARSRLETAVRP